MKGKRGWLFSVFIFPLVFCTCNNFFHDLFPPDENQITRFDIDGQIGAARIGPNTVDVLVAKGTELGAVIPRISVSHKASLIPMTMDYVRTAFPGIDFLKAAMRLYSTPDIAGYVNDLIRENPDFKVPALTLPVDFTGPVTFLVISGQGSMRQYVVNVEIDTGEPKLSGFSFAKYDNPELISDARGEINETGLTVITTAVYPVEMDFLSYALIPSFEIMGERLEIDGVEAGSGETEIQFDKVLGAQTKTVTVWREGVSKNYALTVTFTEDPDTVRSITDFRFYKTDNPGIAANAVASIVNTGDTGTITVQVFYSGVKPSVLIPGFITPGTASVGGERQTSRKDSQDFSAPVEYRVISRNGLYTRLYTVKVEFINLVNAAPRITSFRFNQNINHELVQDTVAEISDGIIMIDVYYGGAYPPDILIPEFTAQGIVTVMGSVQISGSSSQFFNRQIKYTVTNPENPIFTRDYWVQTRMTRDVSADAKITAFGFYPGDNAGLEDPVIGRIDQVTGKITVFAPAGSGVTTRIMYPRFEAVGQVSVGGIVQSSGTSPLMFDTTVTYTVVSANGKNSRDYEVTVRELRSTIFVDCNAWGSNDGTSWQNAFKRLSDAVEAATQFPEDVPKEIWIAAGTYTPGSSAEDYFRLIPYTSYIGGFAGNETAKSQRNIAANKVIISGGLGGGLYSNNLFGSFNGNIALTVNGDLIFEDLTLENARAGGGRGNGAAICAVLPDGAELNISRCNFNGFTAAANGGAVYVSGGSAVIVDSVIENIESVGGGAVWTSGGELTVDNLTLKNISGGGICNSDGTLTVDGLTLRNITGRGIDTIGDGVLLSGIDAGGISGEAVYCVSGGSVRIGGYSKFYNTGMVLVSSSVSVYVTDTEIYNSTDNSALCVDGNAATIIERVTIDGVNGRGIYVNSPNSVQISGSRIRNCATAVGVGGGIYLGGAGDKEISGVTIENCSASSGGGIFITGSGNREISGITIKNCTTGFGGGIYISSEGNNSKISNATIENCTANGDGGGIYIAGLGDKEIFNVTIKNCTATGQGGGISMSDSYKRISNATIENCTANGVGGGIYLANGDNEISGVTIENCKANSNGGGIYLAIGTYEISGSTIENCTAVNGGGIYDYSSLNLSIANTTVRNTVVNDSGGGLYSYDYTRKLVINNSRFENTRAMGGYGAIFANSNESEITGTDFINCTSRYDYKILNAHRFAFIRNSNFTHDSNLVDMGSPSDGSRVVSVFGDVGNFKNCIFTNLKCNYAGENYLFNKYAVYPDPIHIAGGGGGLFAGGVLTLKDCTFNFDSGSAGLLALGGDYNPDTLLMDGCTINNPNNVGQQPLIWLNGNSTAHTFQFGANNEYNGTLLNSAVAIIGLGSNVIRITGNAMPVIVP
jgi:hypothetical protein